MIIPLAADDPLGLPTWTAYPAIFLLITGIVWIVRWSINGTITWPPEKKRMEDTIAAQAATITQFEENANRSIPTTQRVVEFVEQRIVPAATADDKVGGELLSAVRDLTGVVSDLKRDHGGSDE